MTMMESATEAPCLTPSRRLILLQEKSHYNQSNDRPIKIRVEEIPHADAEEEERSQQQQQPLPPITHPPIEPAATPRASAVHAIVVDGGSIHTKASEAVEQQQQQPRTPLITATAVLEPCYPTRVEAIPTAAAPGTTSANPPVKDSTRPDFEAGSHIYRWCWLGIIPGAFAHHAIVLRLFWDSTEGIWKMLVADYSNNQDDAQLHENYLTARTFNYEVRKPISDPLGNKAGFLRQYETICKGWHKVHYSSSSIQVCMARSGTCTRARGDAPGLVCTRVQFLLDNPHVLGKYSLMENNCECVAVWCKTGNWATLQMASWLSFGAAGQIKSAATMASVAATTHVSVPAAGVWGWLGYTTQVSLLSTQPMLLPAIAAYGAVTVGVPTVVLWRTQKQWKKRSEDLSQQFWEWSLQQPEAFAEHMVYWSSQE